MNQDKLTSEQVSQIARLARLSLTDQETISLASDLAAILSHFANLQDIDTNAVPTADDVTGRHNVTRDDVVQADQLCSPSDLLSRAPETQNNLVKVKAVFG